jgi:hypothetical protein
VKHQKAGADRARGKRDLIPRHESDESDSSERDEGDAIGVRDFAQLRRMCRHDDSGDGSR